MNSKERMKITFAQLQDELRKATESAKEFAAALDKAKRSRKRNEDVFMGGGERCITLSYS